MKSLKKRITYGYIIGFILTLVLIVVSLYQEPLERLVSKTFLEILVGILALIGIVLFGRSGSGLIDEWEKREESRKTHVYKNGKELKQDEKGNILKTQK
jgi:general stress protein CsbA